MPIVIRKKDGQTQPVPEPVIEPAHDPPPAPSRPLAADDGPPCRVLVEAARKLQGRNDPTLVLQMADRIEWLAKSYGLWGARQED